MSDRRPHVVAISGSVNRPSKSRALAEAVAQAAFARIDLNVTSYDLTDAGPGLGAAFTRAELSPSAAAIVDALEKADAVIAVSPVYKGSYTGLFKHLFDFVSPTGLVNKPVVVGATGGGHRHGLVVEHQLQAAVRLLLGYDGAHFRLCQRPRVPGRRAVRCHGQGAHRPCRRAACGAAPVARCRAAVGTGEAGRLRGLTARSPVRPRGTSAALRPSGSQTAGVKASGICFQDHGSHRFDRGTPSSWTAHR